MTQPLRARVVLGAALAAAALGVALLVAGFVRHGLSARAEPWAIEATVARCLRHLAVPLAARRVENPLPRSAELLAEARAHFADHCAFCHGNDGRGDTPIGRSLYPKPPDLRAQDTQSLSDGELFYIVENGVRFTGMPAWGGGGAHDEEASWQLVHFIRHLPEITPEEIAEMETLNPRSLHEHEEHEHAPPHHRH